MPSFLPIASKPVVAAALLAFAAGFAAHAASPGGMATATRKDDGGFNTSAPNAMLIEAETGTVLFEKNSDQLIPPASLAKLMTAEVVFNEIREGGLKRDEEFVISVNAWRKGGAPSGGSTMFAILHSKVKVEDLLRGVIIQSANDACIALAEGIAGNETEFARLMNGRARELGLTQSNFGNSTGLPDPDMRVTVRELAKLAQHIVRSYPEFYPLYGEREFTWNRIRQQNRNPLLAMNVGADGMKTGYTQEAGYGLVGSAIQNGLRLIVVVSGLKSDKERGDEARRLLEWGFSGFEARMLFAEGQPIGDAKVYGGEKGSVPLVGAGGQPVRLMVPRNSSDRITARVVYRGPVQAPIEKGKKIGTLRILRGDRVALEVPLEAAEAIGTGNAVQKAIDAAGELIGGAFRSALSKI